MLFAMFGIGWIELAIIAAVFLAGAVGVAVVLVLLPANRGGKK